MELLVLCGAHREGLDMLLLDHWPPKTDYLLTLFSSSSLTCASGIVQTPDASSACCMQVCSCAAALSRGSRG